MSRYMKQNSKVFLIGTMMDARRDCSALKNEGKCPIMTNEGIYMARALGCTAYFEISIKDQFRIHELVIGTVNAMKKGETLAELPTKKKKERKKKKIGMKKLKFW